MKNILCKKLNLQYPLIQAPMAGVSTPELAAAVSNSGALGSISVGASTPEQAKSVIKKTQFLTSAPINVNVFCHESPLRNKEREIAWIEQFHELFDQYEAITPEDLTEIYETFNDNQRMLDVLLHTKPAAVSFHFGIPSISIINKLKNHGITTFATATSIREAQEITHSGVDFIVAQGIEAGGHRGVFRLDEDDQQMSTFTLLQAIRHVSKLPVIAAGGIMNGSGISAMIKAGAEGVQMGTAFVLCPESAANDAYRHALRSGLEVNTVMTSAISGRPARCIKNAFCDYTLKFTKDSIPPYPLAYALGKALSAAASAKGEHGFGAQWAGQGVQLIREIPAAELVRMLITEWQKA